ncbi:hypothetical protein E2C01_055457 [Portunus trituberculatus]|uniref:Uncharacterized protein n=1 Tax=Portunus trituberculatus TaxID=210409 RepID=A0A5B7GVJ0_PORTR|nr:hypothetical protein [Portunus trituberculatus]
MSGLPVTSEGEEIKQARKSLVSFHLHLPLQIESKDSDVQGSDTDIGGSTTKGGGHSSNPYCWCSIGP